MRLEALLWRRNEELSCDSGSVSRLGHEVPNLLAFSHTARGNTCHKILLIPFSKPSPLLTVFSERDNVTIPELLSIPLCCLDMGENDGAGTISASTKGGSLFHGTVDSKPDRVPKY